MRWTLIALFALLSTPALAQLTMHPTPRPIVTATNDEWFMLRLPIQFGGELYYPAGPDVFFDEDVMVRTGHHDGVPLYVDATLEAYSVIFVPMERGLMRPYKRRSGETPQVYLPEPAPTDEEAAISTVPVATTATEAAAQPRATAVASLPRPATNDGLWIWYEGHKWVSAGAAIPADAALRNTGEYKGFPVFKRPEREDVIYLPSRPGWVAPYQRKR